MQISLPRIKKAYKERLLSCPSRTVFPGLTFTKPYDLAPRCIPPPLPRPTNLCSSQTSCGHLLSTPSLTRLPACVAYRDRWTRTAGRLLQSACPRVADVSKTNTTPQNLPTFTKLSQEVQSVWSTLFSYFQDIIILHYN